MTSNLHTVAKHGCSAANNLYWDESTVQVMLNGVRLGGCQFAEDRRLNRKSNGEISLGRTLVIGAAMGALGAVSGSPFFLVSPSFYYR